MQYGSHRSSAKQHTTRIIKVRSHKATQPFTLSGVSGQHTFFEGVTLNAVRMSSFTHQTTHIPESPGKESQGCPNRSRGQAYQSPHTFLEGVKLNSRRMSSFTAKQHTTRITGQGVTRLPHRSRGQAYKSPHASLEGVKLKPRRISSFICQATHNPNQLGKESQGYLTVHAVKHFKSSVSEQQTSFEGVRLNARRIVIASLPSHTLPLKE